MVLKGALLWSIDCRWSIEDFCINDTLPDPVLVPLNTSGFCHSDERLVAKDHVTETLVLGGYQSTGVAEDQLTTGRYSLEHINKGCIDPRTGTNLGRPVVC